MATVTFILGLCGSGKSWLADGIAADIKFHEGFWLPVRRKANLAALATTLRDGGTAIVVDVEFCTAAARQELVQSLSAVPGLTIQWICIENDLSKANDNCRRRQDHGNANIQIGINESLSPQYHYPEGAEIRTMWSPNNDRPSQ